MNKEEILDKLKTKLACGWGATSDEEQKQYQDEAETLCKELNEVVNVEGGYSGNVSIIGLFNGAWSSGVKEVNLQFKIRPYRPCWDVILSGPESDDMIGPMYDGNTVTIGEHTIKIFDRYENQEAYNHLSR